VTPLLIDDQALSALLRGEEPVGLPAGGPLHTTGCWYVRLCQAAMRTERRGALSRHFGHLPPTVRGQALDHILRLPSSIGLLSLRDLGPSIGALRTRHRLNLMASEALAASVALQAKVVLSSPAPRLEAALRAEGCEVVRAA
jgi:hypothetical protein